MYTRSPFSNGERNFFFGFFTLLISYCVYRVADLLIFLSLAKLYSNLNSPDSIDFFQQLHALQHIFG